MKDLAKQLLGSRWVKWAVVVIAIAIGVYEISERWHGVQQGLSQIGLLTSLYALLALFGVQYGTLKAWQVMLAGLGSPLRTTVAGRILFVGQLGKYIPGSVWSVLAAMELGARANVPRSRSASASLITMMMSVLTGLLLAGATLPFASHGKGYLWVFALVPVVIACLHPRVLNPLLNKLFALAKRAPLEQPVTGRVILHALAWAVFSWLFNGLQIWLLADKFGGPTGKTILLSLGGYAFAWCVGFVVVIAPAGAGVRDPLIIAALAPAIGYNPALAVMLVSRAVNTVSDLVMAAVAFAGLRRAGIGVPVSKETAGKAAAAMPAAEEVTPVSSVSDTGPIG